MAEQLHCSEIHSKNIENLLSKLYIFIVFNGGRITNYVTCVSGCFGDVKAEGASLSTPFIIFLPFYRLNEEKGR